MAFWCGDGKTLFLYCLLNRGWMIGCSVVVFDEMEVLFCRLLGLSQGQMLNKVTPLKLGQLSVCNT